MIDIVVLDDKQEELENDSSELIIDVLKFAYDYLKLQPDYEMSVSLVDDIKIREINRDYRNTDAATDVISFALEEADQVTDPEIPHELGDLFISLDKVKSQAEEFNHSQERELAFLAVHGLLHLLGYDHTKSPADEKEMFDLQGKILEEYGLKR